MLRFSPIVRILLFIISVQTRDQIKLENLPSLLFILLQNPHSRCRSTTGESSNFIDRQWRTFAKVNFGDRSIQYIQHQDKLLQKNNSFKEKLLQKNSWRKDTLHKTFGKYWHKNAKPFQAFWFLEAHEIMETKSHHSHCLVVLVPSLKCACQPVEVEKRRKSKLKCQTVRSNQNKVLRLRNPSTTCTTPYIFLAWSK